MNAKKHVKEIRTETDAVAQYKAFVLKQAARYGGHGVAYEDLVQEGLLAVALAFRKWSPTGGASFLTWIRHPVRNAMSKLVDKGRKQGIRGSKQPLLHASMDDVDQVQWLGRALIKSFDTELSLHDVIGDEEPNERDTLALELLPQVVANLKPRERQVIRARFVEEKTFDEIGKSIGVSRERVRQIQEEALKNLRTWLFRRLKRQTPDA